MDCGPACLKALLDGHGIPVSYGRLREACQTDVDGTSIDSLEQIAVRLGLEAEQIVVPADHLFIDGVPTLPALVVTQLPDGLTHFIVAWRAEGQRVQIMDPAIGRRLVSRAAFLADLHTHRMPVPAADWRSYAGDAEFQAACRTRARRLHVEDAEGLLAAALADEGWQRLATLDASLRFVEHLVRHAGIVRGPESSALVHALHARDRADPAASAIPASFWAVRPTSDDDEGEPRLMLRGVVLVRVRGLRAAAERAADEALPGELALALSEPPPRPLGWVWRTLADLEGRRLVPTLLVLAVLTSAMLTVVEGLMFRALLEVGGLLQSRNERLLAGLGLVAVVLFGLGLDLTWTRGTLDLGRRLELRLRTAFLAKLTRLPDHYFGSRLASDMAARAHRLHLLRELPQLAAHVLRDVAQLAAIVIAVVWLYPGAAPLALVVALACVALPLLALPMLSERDLRARTQLGSLLTMHLDAMRGGIAIRSHGAARAVGEEHEQRLVGWVHAAGRLWRAALATDLLTTVVATALTIILVLRHVATGGSIAAVLLLAYWALSLPDLGRSISASVQRLPELRNELIRFLEPLNAPEDEMNENGVTHVCGTTAAPPAAAAALAFTEVEVVATGQPVLRGINLDIAAGEHVAIVGRSGSGKSTLLGLLLGWQRPAAGSLTVDGQPLDGAGLATLRARTAWIDPAVQLWNQPLIANVRYGSHAEWAVIAAAIEDAELEAVLPRLAQGMRTTLGEDGLAVSGGEGQRVRAARALVRRDARLVLLDEAFRGLERQVRARLLEQARQRWAAATLLCVTHDIAEATRFPRVVVLEGGRIVEDGPPAALLAEAGGQLRRMLDEEEALTRFLGEDGPFATLHLGAGAPP
jgi:ATP-binding cassette subfamily B protein